MEVLSDDLGRPGATSTVATPALAAPRQTQGFTLDSHAKSLIPSHLPENETQTSF